MHSARSLFSDWCHPHLGFAPLKGPPLSKVSPLSKAPPLTLVSPRSKAPPMCMKRETSTSFDGSV